MATIEEGRARQRAMRTYCPGFEMRMTRDVTFGDIRRMCASLNATYAEGHEFEPEAISEGGIQWMMWPGKMPRMYKTMRLHTQNHKYPMLHERGGTDIEDGHVAYPKSKRMTTVHEMRQRGHWRICGYLPVLWRRRPG